jgi:hypothetical protein
MTIVLSGTAGITTPTTSTTGEFVTSVTGFKNRIINGSMVLDQRNAGASVTPTNAQYTLDRWQANLTAASKYSVQQSSTAQTGFSKSLLVTSLSAYSVGASDQFNILQKIEGYNIADLAFGTANAKTITLSFWVYSSLTGTFSGSVNNGAFTRNYIFNYTVSSANTWTQASVTIAGDTSGSWTTDNSAGLNIVFGLGSGSTYSGTAGSWGSTYYTQSTGSVSVVGTSGATFYITGVQLEKGSTATSFDYRPYGTEYQLCQRYYQQVNNTAGVELALGLFTAQSATLAYANYFWVVPLRASPTCAITGNMQWTVTGGQTTVTPTTGNPNTYSVLLQIAVSGLTAGQCGRLTIASGASGLLTASAEL